MRVVEVDRPVLGPKQVLVRMKAAGINPGEAAIREGCAGSGRYSVVGTSSATRAQMERPIDRGGPNAVLAHCSV